MESYWDVHGMLMRCPWIVCEVFVDGPYGVRGRPWGCIPRPVDGRLTDCSWTVHGQSADCPRPPHGLSTDARCSWTSRELFMDNPCTPHAHPTDCPRASHVCPTDFPRIPPRTVHGRPTDASLTLRGQSIENSPALHELSRTPHRMSPGTAWALRRHPDDAPCTPQGLSTDTLQTFQSVDSRWGMHGVPMWCPWAVRRGGVGWSWASVG